MSPPSARTLLAGLGCPSLLLALVPVLRGPGLPPGWAEAAAPVVPPAAPVPAAGAPAPAASAPAPAAAAAAASSPALPTDPSLPRAADGRHYPLLPAEPAALAELLARVEEALRSPDTPADALPALGHQQQVIYRVLSRDKAVAEQVRLALPERWRTVLDLHLTARREFLAMHRGERRPARLPAWRIVAPEPAEALLGYYREAAAATGIPWEVLAAVNLVESGMGRIDGVSVADAHGPMQFLPSTWAEPGIGRGGDIRDPHDAIHAAARYLVRRGGPRDLRRALWGYNNSDHYGRAVLAYAALLKADPAAYRGLYHWEIHFASAAGDLWLPVGYEQKRPIPVAQWLQIFPASAPPRRGATPVPRGPAESGAAPGAAAATVPVSPAAGGAAPAGGAPGGGAPGG